MLLLACVAGGLGALQGLGSVDLVLADMLQLPVRGPAPSIVVVGIDDRSVASIGRWPWSRLRHAELLEHLMPCRPRAVGLDLILSEPSTKVDDAVLADVIRRAGNVVLPVLEHPPTDTGAALRPIAPLARAAAALGVIDLDVDVDGVVRTTRISRGQGTDGAVPFPVEMAQRAGAPARSVDGVAGPGGPVLLDFRGETNNYRYVSYADVWGGGVDCAEFEGAHVLVGVTGTGMGDMHATPGFPERVLRPGVYILATALEANLTGRYASLAGPWTNGLLNALPALLVGLCLLGGLAKRAGLCTLAVALAFLMLVTGLRSLAALQVMPLAGLVASLALYGMWTAGRLRRALGFLLEELAHLRTARQGGEVVDAPGRGDDLDDHMHALRQQASSVLLAKKLLEDSLDALPESTFVTDAHGRVMVANASARALFPLPGLTEGHRHVQEVVAQRYSGDWLLERLQAELPVAAAPLLRQLRDTQGRDVLVKCAPRTGPGHSLLGWVVSILEVSPAVGHERHNHETLGYLSHDMRAPQTSILSLLELRRRGALGVPEQELLDRIGSLAEKTLSYADNFIQLMRAEGSDYVLAPHDVLDIAVEVADELWPTAQRRGISIDVAGTPAVCLVDRQLMFRALQNLLDNALKFSPAQTRVACTVGPAPDGRVLVSVRDHGPGIDAATAAQLFTLYRRQSADGGGAGFGLAFVQTVALRHGGCVEATNASGGAGALFRIWLPQVAGPARDLDDC